MLSSGTVQAVIIAAPTPSHQRLSWLALRAGIPVLCEKPCGPAAAGLARLAGPAGDLLRVGYWRRFVPSLDALRRELLDGGLGTLLSVETGQWDEHPPDAEYQRHCGSIFADMAVHDLDQIQWLAGQPITTVQAIARQARPGQPPPAALLLLGLAEGIVGAASFGRWFPGGDACWVRVHGSAGFRDLHFLSPPDSDRQMIAAVRAQDEAFAALVTGAADPRLATAADAAAALAAAEAAEQAAASPSATDVLSGQSLLAAATKAGHAL